ncbi:hypothetical protein TKK_0010981 [Trichogramma kaykai]
MSGFYIKATWSYRVLSFLGKSLTIWPLDRGQSKGLGLLLNCFWWFYLLNYVAILVPTFYGLYNNRRNIVSASYSWIESTVFTEAIAVMIFSRWQRSRLESLFRLAEKQLAVKKRRVVRFYANYYAIVYLATLAFYVCVVMMYIILEKPKTGNNELALSASYPFRLEDSPIKWLLWVNQAIVFVHAYIVANFDGIAVFLIFTCTDRLKQLDKHFRDSRSYEHLVACVREHNDVLALIKDTNRILRFMVLKTTAFFMSYVFGAGLQILNNTAQTVMIHQISILFLAYARLYLCAESANNMSAAGRDIAMTVYSTSWYDENPKMSTAKTIIIQKCQREPIIFVSGLMSALDRRYLRRIFSATISYLMTLRTIVGSK